MFADGRDLVAIIALEKRLGVLRERVAERIVAGGIFPAEELAAAEQEAVLSVKRDFYTSAVRQVIKPAQAGISDDQDHDARGQRLAEDGLWFSHRGLLAIPLVGDPAFAATPPRVAGSGSLMEFINRTGWPAKWLAGSTGEREMLGIAVCKATWRISDDRLVPAAVAEHWPVFDKPFAFAGVTFPGEIDHRKQGTDLVIVGQARAPGGKAVTQLEVSAQCGRLHHRTLVFGDRRWERSWGRFRASAPTPFREMPLTNDRAFGGQASYDGQPLPHVINPVGRGYHLTKDDADGQPLPNLERPDRLISAWNDAPLPACWIRPAGPLELGAGGDPATMARRLMVSGFNLSVPELIADDGVLGERLLLRGFAAEGPLDLPLPPAHGPVAHVKVGALTSVMPSRLSAVVVLPEVRAVVGTYHCLFRYLMLPRDRRSLELRWPEGAAHV